MPTPTTKPFALTAAAAVLAGLSLAVGAAAHAAAPAKKAAAKPTGRRAAPPPLAPARPLRLPAITERTLSNGLRLVVLTDRRQPAVWVRFAVPAGSVRDPRGKMGLAEMTAGLLDKGTATRSESQIADLVDGLGATLSASADEDHLVVSASGLSAHADTLLNLVADVALRPTFPEAEIARYRTRTENAIRASLAEPGALADAAIRRSVFGAHPYGNYASGTPQTLASITRDDLVRFRDAHFAPNAATLFLVGDVTPAQAEAKVRAAFGNWERKDVPAVDAATPVAAPGATRPRITLIDRPGAPQTEIRVSVPTPGYADPDRVAGSVATAVLGLGQFEGRLTREIRVKRGLTYGAASYFDRNQLAGRFEITTFTKTPSTGEVLRIALEEADKLARVVPPSDELRDRRNFLLGSFAVSVATPDGVLRRLVPAVLYGGGPQDLERYTARVQAVTPGKVRDIVRGLNVGRAASVVLVGDAKAVEPQVRNLGTVTRISADAVDLASPTLVKEGAAATPTAAAATTPATAEEQAAGRALLDTAVKAHGGDAFLNLKTLELKGKGDFAPPAGPGGGPGDFVLPLDSVTLVSAAPDKSRIELRTAFGDFAVGAPGGGAKPWLLLMGKVRDAPPGGIAGAGDPTQLLRSAAASNSGFTVRPLPPSDAPRGENGDKPLTGFALEDAKGRTTRVYVDPATNLVRRAVTGAGTSEVVIHLGHYRAVDNVQLPGTMRVTQNNKDLLRLRFDSVAVDRPIDDARFARPADAPVAPAQRP